MRDKGRGAVDWREVVTSIRHDTPALWQRLDTDERRRFLDHLRPYWETHRHRSSPETALGVAELIEAGRLHVIAGRLERLSDDGDAVLVTFSRRGTTTLESLRVGKVLNCTGPDTDLARVRDPLVAALRRDGLIRPDELGLGLDSDEDGRLIAADGRTSSRLSLVGPLRKGRLWENTAVPGSASRRSAWPSGWRARPRCPGSEIGPSRSTPGVPHHVPSERERPSTREAGPAGRPAWWPACPGRRGRDRRVVAARAPCGDRSATGVLGPG